MSLKLQASRAFRAPSPSELFSTNSDARLHGSETRVRTGDFPFDYRMEGRRILGNLELSL